MALFLVFLISTLRRLSGVASPNTKIGIKSDARHYVTGIGPTKINQKLPETLSCDFYSEFFFLVPGITSFDQSPAGRRMF